METPRYCPPDGYEYDPESGYYVNKVPAEDDNGNRVMVVTRFNAMSGEYMQKVFPINQQLNNPQSGNLRAQVQSGRAKSARMEQPANRRNGTKKADMKRVAIIIGIVVIALAIIGAVIWMILRGRGDSGLSDTKSKASLSDDVGEDGANGANNEETDVDEEQKVVFEGDLTSTYPWPDVPTVSVYNNTVDEDDTYVYALNCSEPSFEDNNGCPRGTIIRFGKDGNWDGVNVMYDGSLGDAYAVSVMGDYMYYSVYNGSEYEYRRMNKNTREDSLMFKEDYSFISCYDGYVCCLFTRGGRHEMLRYRTDEYGYSTAEYFDVLESLGQYSDATLVIPFSVFNGILYYSGYNSEDTFVATFDPDTQISQTIAVTQSMAEFKEEASGDGMLAAMFSRNQGFVENYGLHPFILPDNTAGLADANCITQHALLCNHRTISFTGYKDGTCRGAFGRVNERAMEEQETDEEGSSIYSFNDQLVFPCESYLVGTSENWVITNGGAVLTDGYGILMQKSLNEISETDSEYEDAGAYEGESVSDSEDYVDVSTWGTTGTSPGSGGNPMPGFRLSGTYYACDSSYGDGQPWIDLREDGYCRFHMNEGSMVYDLDGWYTYDESMEYTDQGADIKVDLFFYNCSDNYAKAQLVYEPLEGYFIWLTEGFGLMGGDEYFAGYFYG